MGKKLPKVQTNPQSDKLLKSTLQREEVLFKIAFSERLDNNYEVKDMRFADITEFHKFLSDTVYKGLTISEVDKLFLRKQGLGDAPAIVSDGKELLHYGKDMNPFRLFGYYNKDGYFVVCRIDGRHKTHKG